MKAIIKKTAAEDLNTALMCYRVTPLEGESKSPAELLLGRTIRSNLPVRTTDNAHDMDYLTTFLLVILISSLVSSCMRGW